MIEKIDLKKEQFLLNKTKINLKVNLKMMAYKKKMK